MGELGSSQKSTVKKIAAGALGATMMLGMMTVFMTSVPADVPVLGDSSDTETIGTPNFDEAGRYVLTDYDQSKPFASFLPSVNGKYGMPMWSFYVNRGQVRGSRGSRPQPQPQPTRARSALVLVQHSIDRFASCVLFAAAARTPRESIERCGARGRGRTSTGWREPELVSNRSSSSLRNRTRAGVFVIAPSRPRHRQHRRSRRSGSRTRTGRSRSSSRRRARTRRPSTRASARSSRSAAATSPRRSTSPSRRSPSTPCTATWPWA